MRFLDGLGADPGKSRLARVTGRALTLGLLLFAVAIPHSIAAAHTGLNLALLSWIIRDLSAGKLHFRRTPLDAPLLCFIAFSVLSALFSVEPRLSVRKLLTLLLFGVIYLCAANLTARGARVLLAALLVSALAGVRYVTSYEGQAAIELEWASAALAGARPYGFELEREGEERRWVVDTRPLVRDVVRDVERGAGAPEIGRRFHLTLALIIAEVCERLREDSGLDRVVLGGGVFANTLLCEELERRMPERGFSLFRPRALPPGDAGLSLGQLGVVSARIAEEGRA